MPETLGTAGHEEVPVEDPDLAETRDTGLERQQSVVERQRRTGTARVEDADNPILERHLDPHPVTLTVVGVGDVGGSRRIGDRLPRRLMVEAAG